jgi:hypothetical protein
LVLLDDFFDIVGIFVIGEQFGKEGLLMIFFVGVGFQIVRNIE